MTRVGLLLLGVVLAAALAAPVIAAHDPHQRFENAAYAPPMPIHIIDDQGHWRTPFVYPVILVDRLERRYAEDRNRPVTLAWLSDGALLRMPDETAGPWLWLGGDSLGRDVWARLVHGARVSLGVALLATLGALLLGVVVGGLAGVSSPGVDEWLMRFTDFVVVLPAMYVVLALRAALPLVLPAGVVFALVTGLLALIGWPIVARGVRAIVATESSRDYSQAALALGAGRGRLLVRHLLPATRGFLAAQATLLLPAFILAEATLSYVGLGFPEPAVSWGVVLQEAANVAALADAPWMLSPAVAIFVVSLAVNLIVRGAGATAAHPGRARQLL